jgi:hypothetical protein
MGEFTTTCDAPQAACLQNLSQQDCNSEEETSSEMYPSGDCDMHCSG